MKGALRRYVRIVGATALLFATGAVGGAPITGVAANVMPVPASSHHLLGPRLSFPPDTAYCQANFGISCYQPAQLQRAYHLHSLIDHGIDGRGRTIVIVDAFGSPTIGEDLRHFDRTFGLPDPPNFTVLQPAGPVPQFPNGSPLGPSDVSGWAVETTLDVEWSHVMAPGANILLVETPVTETEGVQGFPEIVQAENYVINHHLGDVISQSFGATELTFPSVQSIRNLRGAFINAHASGVTVLASSGDAGATDLLPDGSCCYAQRVNSWPSADPLVTSIGGTQLHLDANGVRTAPDNVWNDFAVFGPDPGAGGGGRSFVFSQPPFQNGVQGVVQGQRGTPDISMSAAVDGAVVFYYSFCDYSRNDPNTGQPPNCGPQWHLVGGTSESSPLFAGIVALAAQKAGHSLGFINPALYAMAAINPVAHGIVDVTHGDNTYVYCSSNCGQSNEEDTTVPGLPARAGYDLSSGLGTVDASRFAPALAAALK